MRIFFSALLALGGLAGCAGSKVTVSNIPAAEAAPAADTLAMQVFATAQDTVLAPLVAAWPRAEAPERKPPDVSETPDSGLAMIYRVQLLTTKDLARAMAVRDEASADFGMDVRVDFETPYYKVRVGEFRTPQEAEALLKDARLLGYRGAWAVRMRADSASD